MVRRNGRRRTRPWGAGSKGGTGRDLAEGAGLVGGGGVLPWESCPPTPGRSPRPSPQRPFPPDPALSRPGLSEEQRNQEQQEESSGSHAPHPGGLGRESGGCSETL